MKSSLKKVLLEVLAGIILIVLINFESYQDHRVMGKAQLLSHVSWFEDRYEYHPYLSYAQKKIDELVRIESVDGRNDPDTLRLAIQGGSFAMFFADFLEERQTKEILKELAQELGFKDINVINMASGGHRQPQQAIASTLWLNRADFFVSIEGFNEYAEATHECLPPEWPRGGVRFNPNLKDNFYFKAAGLIKSVFLGLHSWSEGYDPLGKVTFFFVSKPLLSLFFTADANFFRDLGESDFCKNTNEDMKKKYAKQMKDRNSDWEKYIRRHHHIHSPKKNLITVFQPNQHYTDSKPLSQYELDILAGRKFDFIDKFYPLGREMFKKLSREGFKVYDLTMVFKDNKDSLYKDYCCHVNNDGNKAFLKALVPLLKQNLPKKGLHQ